MTDMAEREDAEATAVLGEHENDDSGVVVSLGDGWDNNDGAGQRPEDEAGHKVVVAFGRTMKTLRLREGLERGEFGKRLGYSASTIASFEQGRRIPTPHTIERADEILKAGGLLCHWKEQVERAQYPVFFQGMAALEKEAMELLVYDTLVVNGLLQTEEYMRALLTMRRPPLKQDTIEQRVVARLARQDIIHREPAPLLNFVMDESVLLRKYGGTDVHRTQLKHLLFTAEQRNIELQIMPLNCAENAGVDGPFSVVVRRDGKQFVYAEAQGTSSLEMDPARAARASSRYGIIRSQALTPRESTAYIEGLLGSL